MSVIVAGIDGFYRCADPGTGEMMHPLGCPAEEARAIYVDQVPWSTLLACVTSDPLVVWDVGLGMATNALAVIDHWSQESERTFAGRNLFVCSFDVTLMSLRKVAASPKLFPHARSFKPLLNQLIANHLATVGSCTWRYYEGDFFDRARMAPLPNYIAYDPYSWRTTPDFWSVRAFSSLTTASNLYRDGAAILITYSTSTSTRAGLIAHGWRVKLGCGFGRRTETTVVLTPFLADFIRQNRQLTKCPRFRYLAADLPHEWWDKWRRSDSKWPVQGPECGAAQLMWATP